MTWGQVDLSQSVKNGVYGLEKFSRGRTPNPIFRFFHGMGENGKSKNTRMGKWEVQNYWDGKMGTQNYWEMGKPKNQHWEMGKAENAHWEMGKNPLFTPSSYISADSGRHSGPVKISIDSTVVDDSSAQSGQKLVDTFTDATPTLCLFRALIWL